MRSNLIEKENNCLRINKTADLGKTGNEILVKIRTYLVKTNPNPLKAQLPEWFLFSISIVTHHSAEGYYVRYTNSRTTKRSDKATPTFSYLFYLIPFPFPFFFADFFDYPLPEVLFIQTPGNDDTQGKRRSLCCENIYGTYKQRQRYNKVHKLICKWEGSEGNEI